MRAKFQLQRSNLTLPQCPKDSNWLMPFTEFITNRRLLISVLFTQQAVTNSVRDTPRGKGRSYCPSGDQSLVAETRAHSTGVKTGGERRGGEGRGEEAQAGLEKGTVLRGGEEGEQRPSQKAQATTAAGQRNTPWSWGVRD